MPRKYESNRRYSTSPDILFIKCQEAVGICGFELKNTIPSLSRIEARVGMSIWSFGENLSIQVAKDSSVWVSSQCTSQIIDYGKNRRNVERFFMTLTTLVAESAFTPVVQPLHNAANVEILQERRITEQIWIIDVEELPLDNRMGSDVLTIEHEFSKTASNELSLEIDRQAEASIGFALLNIIKTKISAGLSKKSGHKFGESVSRRCTLTFSIKPGDFVVYKVTWKQRQICGEYEVTINRNRLTVPFNAFYDLEYEVATHRPVK